MYSFEHHDEALTLRPEGHRRRGARVRRARGAQRRAGHALVVRRADVPRRAPAARALPAVLPARRRDLRRRGPGLRRRDDRHARRLPAASCAIPDVEVLVNSLGGRRDARALPRRARRSTSTPKAASLSADSQRRLDDQPAAHPRLEGRARSARPSRGAPTIHDFLDDDDRDALRRAARAHLDALGTPYTVDAAARPRARLLHAHALRDQRRARQARRRQHARSAAGATTAWSKTSAARGPAIGFAAGLERLLIASELDGRRRASVDAFVAPLGRRGDGRGARPRARAAPERRPLRGRHARQLAQEPAPPRQRARRARGAHPRRRRARRGRRAGEGPRRRTRRSTSPRDQVVRVVADRLAGRPRAASTRGPGARGAA